MAQSGQPTAIVSHHHTPGWYSVAREARSLFERRKIAYLALAALTAGAYIYVASLTSTAPHDATASANHVLSTITNTGGSTMNTAPSTEPASPSGTDQPNNQGAADNTNVSSTTITVNGQTIPVPANGTLHTTVAGSGNSSTSVDITHTSSSSGDANQSTTFNMQVSQ